MMKSKKGSVSVEALIVVTCLILMMTFLFQMIVMLPQEDIKTQYVYDALDELENHYYLYKKVGFTEVDFTTGHKDVDVLIRNIQMDLDNLLVSDYLKFIFIETIHAHHMTVKEFELIDDRVVGRVAYNKLFMFGIEETFEIHFDKRLWLFGSDPSMYPNKTLAELLNQQNEDEKNKIVYQTKTGGKYHLKGCFYLVRSTTDHDKIISMSLDKAKNSLHLQACRRCIKGEVWKSTNK